MPSISLFISTFAAMLREKLTILFLLIAQVIILGHSFVPHHHHTDLVGQQNHHQHHHHHDKDSKDEYLDETPLQLAFSDFIHVGEHLIFTNTDTTKIVASKDALKAIKALPSDFKAPVEYLIVYQKHTFPPDRQRNYKSPQNGIHKLRGPPAFIVA